MRELLVRGANIEAAMNQGATSLYVASREGHLDVVRELLARGANANAAFNTGTMPLILASWRGHAEIVGTPSAAGADNRLSHAEQRSGELNSLEENRSSNTHKKCQSARSASTQKSAEA